MKKCICKDIVCVRDSNPKGCTYPGFGCWCCLVATTGKSNSVEILWDNDFQEQD